ncbi:hypothetical protein [Komagataeibacter rhaeticus]|uniref:hypothetical protein n=1 Tax=Komagataeibacter rhaeticus TaxID=215221 RepID=UPI001CD32F40|nr:hypothetical protein [Komagataeibacter rhaeticus]
MKKMILCLGMLGMAGCAAQPSAVTAQYVNPEPFMRRTCAQLAWLDETDTQALATAGTRAPAYARPSTPGQIRGELEAVHTAERGKNCVGRYNATDYDSSGVVYPDRILPDSTAPAATALPRSLPARPDVNADTGTGTGTGSITAHSSVAQQKLSTPGYTSPASRPASYPTPTMPVPAAGYTSPSYSTSPFQ